MSSHLTKFNGADVGQRRVPAGPKSQDIIEISSPINFRQIGHVLLEKWWLILLVAITAAFAARHYAEQIPAKYTAKTVLQVELEQPKLIDSDGLSGQDLRSSDALNTIVQNIKNTSVLRRVVRNEKLSSDPDFIAGKKNLPELQLIRALGGMVTAKLRQDTRLIDITVTHLNAAMAERLANAIAQEFIRENLDARFSTTQAVNEMLFGEAGKLKLKLETSEKQIQAYKEASQSGSLEDRQNIVVEKLKELNRKYTEAKSDRLRAEADFLQVKTIEKDADSILLLPSVQADPAVSDLRRKIVDQEAHVATLSLRYKPKYPKMMQAQRQLDDLKQTLRDLALRVPRTIKSSYENAVARETSLRTALKEAEMESLDLDKKGIQYNVLLREVQSDRALYDSVLKRLKETDISKGLERAAIAVVEPALRPGAPIKPPSQLIMAAAFLAGAFGCFGLLYVGRVTNSSIQTVDQAETLLGLPVWAAIPATKKRKALPHITAEEPASICSESFRTLRATTNITQPVRGKRLLLFTSADPSEGKSFCSLNHAICQAQEGKRTLLIDLDLRRPSIGDSFSLPSDTPGVTDYLLGKDSLAHLAKKTNYANLFVLPAGTRIPDPAEQLSNGAIQTLLDEASREFDRVIIDTAPINAVSDTFLILPLADVVCLVVRSGKTSRRAVQRAIEVMQRANVPPTGIVLNFLPKRNGYGNYRHYSSNYTAYKEVYSGGATPKALAG